MYGTITRFLGMHFGRLSTKITNRATACAKTFSSVIDRTFSPKTAKDAIIYGQCARFSLYYFPVLLVFLYIFSIKQTGATGDCPVAIDLNKNGKIDITGFTATQDKLYTLFSTGRFVQFDAFGSGEKMNIDWIKPNTDGLIIEWDPKRPKSNLTGLDLMGPRRVYEDGRDESFENGYQKMATFDTNGDGELSGAELEKLAVWVDNGNAKLDDGEIHSFKELKIASVGVQPSNVIADYGFYATRSIAQTENDDYLLTEDVWFLNEQTIQPGDLILARSMASVGL
jgi:hypothetical protein